MFRDLITNAALLVTLTALYGLLSRFRRIGALRDRILAGLLFGALAVVAMQFPFRYEPGVIYDGRSIVLTLGGLFGGGLTAAISIVIAGTARVILGGTGVWAGVTTVVSCTLVGLYFRRLCGGRPETMSPRTLYYVGLATHVVMLLSQLLLPWPEAFGIIGHVWLPVMLIFPVVTMLVGIMLGTEERRIATEQDLSRSRAEYVTTFNLSPDAITITTLDGTFVNINDGFTRLTGYGPDQAIGRSVIQLGIWAEPEDRRTMVDTLMEKGHVLNLETSLKNRDGSLRTVLVSACFLGEGDAKRILSFTRNITERAQLERRLRQSQRMETVGVLAGGIAHDFNNLLTVITGYAELVLSGLNESHPHNPPLREIQRAAQRAADITRQLLVFSRKQPLRPVALDLNRAIRELLPMITRLIGEQIEVITRLSEDLEAVEADPAQIEQVIMNLVINARDAMSGGGRLTLETRVIEIPDGDEPVRVGLPAGRYVRLLVEDTGTGMDRKIMEHIFDPFFTTKDPDRGTGLGLATVHGIVSQSGGTIECESEPGIGTTFLILFPCTDRVPEAEGDAGIDDLPSSGEGHILVVEDEEGVRRLLAEILDGLGFNVREAANGSEALQLVDDGGFRPDLLITDIVMPGMGGIELVDHLREIIPDLRYLFMSGYAERVEELKEATLSSKQFLQKPFGSIRDVAARVEEALRSHPPEQAPRSHGGVGPDRV